jgi:hypothetical protein
VVSIDLRGPSTAQLAKCASCSAQDDGLLGWVKKKTEGTGRLWALGVHFFVGGDELPAPGFGEVFEVWVIGPD